MTTKSSAAAGGKDFTQVRLRVPQPLKKFLARAAFETESTVQELALQALEEYRAKNPHLEFDVRRRVAPKK